jgi:hypothetical protein
MFGPRSSLVVTLMGHHSSPRLDLLANGVGVFCSPGVGLRVRVLDGYRGPRCDLLSLMACLFMTSFIKSIPRYV